MPVDSHLSHSEPMDGVLGSCSRAVEDGLLQNKLADLSSIDRWNRDFPWDSSGSNESDALLLFTNPTPTPVESTFFPAASSAGLPDLFEALDPDLRNMSSVDFGVHFPQQQFSPISMGCLRSERENVFPLTGLNDRSGPVQQAIGESSVVTQVGETTSDSRYTITIDGAEPDTVMQVMKILVASRAVINFQSAQNAGLPTT